MPTRVVSTGVGEAGVVAELTVHYKPGRPVVLQCGIKGGPGWYDPQNLDTIRRTGLPDNDIVWRVRIQLGPQRCAAPESGVGYALTSHLYPQDPGRAGT